MNTRMDRSRLNIGAYILAPYARTEEHIRDIAAAGVDFIVCMEYDKPALDLFLKYGVGAIVSGILPGWWGGDGHNAGTMAEKNPLEKYEEAARNFIDHPAIWGIDTGDEPSALDFEQYGKIIDLVETRFSRQFAYLNLYPNYASVAQTTGEQRVSQLGTPTYEEYIKRYCEYVPTDYICYDFYMYSASVSGAYENLRIVSDACLRTGRSLWIVLQVNSSRPEEWTSENRLRFQAYSAMAFGAESIIWACYTAGWWHNQVLDSQGNKTEQYEKLKKVNAEIKALGVPYMKYRRVSTHFVGFEGTPYLAGVNQAPLSKLNTGVFFDVCDPDGGSLVVGEMAARCGGSRALFVCAANDPLDKSPSPQRVSFRVGGDRLVRVYSSSGYATLERSDGVYTVEIAPSSAVLIVAD